MIARLSSDLSQLEVTTRIQGSGNENTRGTLWVDSSTTGNAVYVSGGTDSSDFPKSVGDIPDSTTGTTASFCPVSGYCSPFCETDIRSDAFVVKLDRADGMPLWIRVIGGNEDDRAWGGVRVDPITRDIYIGGCTRSPAIGPGGLIDGYDTALTQPTYGARSGPADGFVAKLDKDDGRMIGLAYIGGSGTDWIAFNDCLEVNNDKHVVVSGLTRSTDLLPSSPSFQPLNANHSLASPDDCDFASNDVFFATFSADLSTLVYATYVNQTPSSARKADKREECAGLAIYGDYVLLTGETDSGGFPVTTTAFDPDISTAHTEYSSCPPISCPQGPTDFHDAFLLRILPGRTTASTLHYGTFFGGDQAVGGATESGNRGRCLAVFPNGHAYAGKALFCGMTTADDFASLTTPGVVQPAWLSQMPPDKRAGFVAIHDLY